MKKKFSLKKKMFLVSISAIILNSIILALCYRLYIVPGIETSGNYLEKSVVSELSYVSDEELSNRLTALSDKYKIQFKVIDKDNVVIYNNVKVTGEDRYLFSGNFKISDNSYYVMAVRSNKVSMGNAIKNLIVFQIMLLLIIGIFSTLFTSRTFLTPLEETIQDMNNYKLGKKPKKRKIVTQMDYIQNEFVDLVDDLEEEKQVQNNIISSISHDIKTPLTSIIGYTHLLKEENISKEDKNKYVDKIYNKSLLMKDIINDFDDYLITNSKRTFKYKNIDFEEFMKDIEDDYKDDLLEKNIFLTIENKCKNIYVNMDVPKIKRVFSNIISNSVRYSHDKGKIIINCYDDGNQIVVTIADNGKGVAEENLSKIFEPLFTTDPSRKISGLGLAICKDIVEAHSGIIKAYNNELGGLTIMFTISKNIRMENNDVK